MKTEFAQKMKKYLMEIFIFRVVRGNKRLLYQIEIVVKNTKKVLQIQNANQNIVIVLVNENVHRWP